MIDPKWAEYGTPRQAECVRLAVASSVSAAARQMGISRATARELIDKARMAASRAGYAPEADYTHPQPKPFVTKGVSTLYRADGSIGAQWVKSKLGDEYRDEVIREAAKDLAESVTPGKRVPPPKRTDEDLICVYPFGDPHWGMFAWPEETGGEAWDLKLAQQTFVRYIDEIVDRSPPSKHALAIDLGDAFHTDNSTNRTNASGHALDVDTRWARVFKMGAQIMRYLVDRLLKKHENVTVWCLRGNHDDHTAFTLACVLEAFYRENPRVSVDTRWSKFHFLEFGVNMFCATHGDTCKREKIGEVMACHDGGAMWGRTRERKAFSGHIHHQTVLETPGVISETYNTLAPADAWHANAGYSAKRDLKCEIYHREHGLVGVNVARVLKI